MILRNEGFQVHCSEQGFLSYVGTEHRLLVPVCRYGMENITKPRIYGALFQ